MKPIRIKCEPCHCNKRPEKVVTEDGRIFLFWSEAKEPITYTKDGVLYYKYPKPFDFNKPIFKDTKLYAIYEDSVKVDFYDDENVVDTQFLAKGQRAKDPIEFVKNILGKKETSTHVILDDLPYEGEEINQDEDQNG